MTGFELRLSLPATRNSNLGPVLHVQNVAYTLAISLSYISLGPGGLSFAYTSNLQTDHGKFCTACFFPLVRSPSDLIHISLLLFTPKSLLQSDGHKPLTSPCEVAARQGEICTVEAPVRLWNSLQEGAANSPHLLFHMTCNALKSTSHGIASPFSCSIKVSFGRNTPTSVHMASQSKCLIITAK